MDLALLSLYIALLCTGFGLYEWYLFGLRPAAFAKIRVYFISAAVALTVWSAYFWIWGADELNVGRHYILDNKIDRPEESNFIYNYKVFAAAYWIVGVSFLCLFSHWVSNDFRF